MVTFENVSFSYQTGMETPASSVVLKDVNLHIKKGECIVLCGKSGCGKTTMLRLVNGLAPHFYAGNLQGAVRVHGMDIPSSDLPKISRFVGSVFQNPRTQFFHMDTTGEMAFNLENQNMPREKMKKRLEEVAYHLHLEELLERDIFELSGGEKQQIACGSVYASLPEVVVLDEPSSNLDMDSIQKLQKLIRTMKEDGKTILMSEHRLWYLSGMTDRYILMDNGRIIREYEPKEINALTQQERTALGLRAVNPQQLHIMPETANRNLNQEPAIEIHGLTFNRGQRQVLDIRHLAIPKGAIVAVIGENGAGKSTLSLCLAGLLRHNGTIMIEGKTVPNKRLPETAFLVMQEAGHQLFSDSVMGELTLNNPSLTEEQAQAVLRELGLAGLENRHPGSLSGGQQQRLSLATAICNRRPVMLYDEPTSGQDGDNLLRTVEIIRKANENAVCSLIVSHDPELIARCATHILHIHAGEVKKLLPLDERGNIYMWKVFREDAQTRKPQKTGIPRLLEFTAPFGPMLFLSQLLAGASALLLLAPFLCVYFAARELLDFLLGGSIDASALAYWGLWALGFELTGLIVNFIALLLSHKAAFHTEQNLKMAVLEHLSRLPLGYFEENSSGKLRKIIDENSKQTESYLAHQLPDLVGAQVSMVAAALLMLAVDWRIGLPVLVLMMIGFAFQMSMMGEETMNFMKRYQDAQEDMSHEAVEYVRGISVIKIFGQSVHSLRRFKEAIHAYRDDALAYTMACKPGYVAFNTVVNSSFLALIPAALIGMAAAADLETFAQNFLFYLIFAPACAAMLNKLMYMTNYKMQAVESMRRIDEILLTREQAEPREFKLPQGNDVRFNHVTFTYPTGEGPAISDVSFLAKGGTVTALVGHSGSGKSTIGSLIPRFYDIQEGCISIGGVALSSMNRKALMERVAFVFQNPKLLKASIEENVRGGKKNAVAEDILNALHLAGCDDILEKLPDGIHTMIGGKGVYLSGGEIQRLAIARAILKDAPIIVLDEATAFADPENEAQIQQALKELTKNKTVIMIAHRLSTITDADQIIVMKGGQIAEYGRHEELAARQGEYARMWTEYQKSIRWQMDNAGNTAGVHHDALKSGQEQEVASC